MKEKYKKAIKKSKKTFNILLIIWVVLLIIVVSPISYTIVEVKGTQDAGTFIGKLIESVIRLDTFKYMLSIKYISTFVKVMLNYTVLFIIFSIIGIIKSAPKSEYEKIEHGSSDWSKNGEQYKILSNEGGIILAEDNYLPLTKRGNLNLLIVGRIRKW